MSDINIDVTGGRLWKLDPSKKGYRLLHQTGNVPKINPDFILPLSENPIFEIISYDRTVLADETNKYLIKKGIFKYTKNSMYVFGLLILFVPGLIFASKAALLLAAFNYGYAWMHYFTLELPDIRQIYSKT